jgi:hypothetical protein
VKLPDQLLLNVLIGEEKAAENKDLLCAIDGVYYLLFKNLAGTCLIQA